MLSLAPAGPDSRPEPYINRMRGLTPPQNMFGVGGLHGGCCSNWMTNWGPAGPSSPLRVLCPNPVGSPDALYSSAQAPLTRAESLAPGVRMCASTWRALRVYPHVSTLILVLGLPRAERTTHGMWQNHYSC